jgi:protein tyrosine/serine phosphatase
MTQWLDWPECINARELGGLPAAGGRIRDNALFRSDSHVSLTDDSLGRIRALGIGLVLDLRAEQETAAAPSPFHADAFYRNVPLLDPAGSGEFTTLADVYRARIIDRSGERVGSAIAAVADAPAGAVLVHCHAGADRTGITIALLLGIAGVDRDSIVGDYAARGPSWPSAYSGLQPETIARTLDHVDAEYGGIRSYLTGHGVSASQFDGIRNRLISAPA